PPPIGISTSPVNPSCAGTSTGGITVTASGGAGTLTYSEDNGQSYQPSNVFSNLAAGTYQIVVKDANTCTKEQDVTLTDPTAVVASIGAPTNVSCNGGSNGSASASGSGGTGPYTFSWNTTPVQTTATATGLAAGTYTVTVTDANHCTTQKSVTITQPTAVVATIGVPTNVSCNGGSDGSASASGSGGTGPYTFSLNTTPVQTHDE